MKDQEWADDLTLFADSLPEIELVGRQCFAFVSDLALSMTAKTAVRVFGPVTGHLGQQLLRRRGGSGPQGDQCKIEAFVCKGLRSDCLLLGVWFTQNLYGVCHFRFKYKKCLKAIGKHMVQPSGYELQAGVATMEYVRLVYANLCLRNPAFSVTHVGGQSRGSLLTHFLLRSPSLLIT